MNGVETQRLEPASTRVGFYRDNQRSDRLNATQLTVAAVQLVQGTKLLTFGSGVSSTFLQEALKSSC